MTKTTLKEYGERAAHKFGLDPRDDFQRGLALGIELSWLSATEAGQGQRHDYAVTTPDQINELRQQVKSRGLGDLDAAAWRQSSDATAFPRFGYVDVLRSLAGEKLWEIAHQRGVQNGLADMDSYNMLKTDTDTTVQALGWAYAVT